MYHISVQKIKTCNCQNAHVTFIMHLTLQIIFENYDKYRS